MTNSKNIWTITILFCEMPTIKQNGSANGIPRHHYTVAESLALLWMLSALHNSGMNKRSAAKQLNIPFGNFEKWMKEDTFQAIMVVITNSNLFSRTQYSFWFWKSWTRSFNEHSLCGCSCLQPVSRIYHEGVGGEVQGNCKIPLKWGHEHRLGIHKS